MVQHSVISRDNSILGGTPVFVGTRVPVQTLLDYLEGDQSFYALSAITTIGRAEDYEVDDDSRCSCLRAITHRAGPTEPSK